MIIVRVYFQQEFISSPWFANDFGLLTTSQELTFHPESHNLAPSEHTVLQFTHEVLKLLHSFCVMFPYIAKGNYQNFCIKLKCPEGCLEE